MANRKTLPGDRGATKNQQTFPNCQWVALRTPYLPFNLSLSLSLSGSVVAIAPSPVCVCWCVILIKRLITRHTHTLTHTRSVATEFGFDIFAATYFGLSVLGYEFGFWIHNGLGWDRLLELGAKAGLSWTGQLPKMLSMADREGQREWGRAGKTEACLTE